MTNIDIVILWVNPEDKSWRKDYEKFSKLENRKTEGSTRYRDYGTLNYLFRGIEKNASWVNNVHLILSSESQVPDWLNRKNERLRIHYHREFIPINLLPTFNSNCIELFLHRIVDLSEHYILFNDDQFIINKLDEDMFVIDDTPVFCGNEVKLKFNLCTNNIFKNTLDNNLKFEINYCSDRDIEIKKYTHHHLPEIHVKSNERSVVEKNKEMFILSLIESRFRHRSNFTNWVFSDIVQLENRCLFNRDLYKDSIYTTMSNDLDYEKILSKKIVCMNDKSSVDFELCSGNLKRFLNSIYPNKSSFEK